MDLAMAIKTGAIEGKYIHRFSGGGRMARQHMNMALLAQQMNASGQKLGIVRTMRRVTIHTIFAGRRMLPEKRATFFGMAAVTKIIDGMIREHLAPLATMRIVAGSTADLHVAMLGAEQMGGALRHSFPLFLVAGKTGILDCEIGQQPFG